MIPIIPKVIIFKQDVQVEIGKKTTARNFITITLTTRIAYLIQMELLNLPNSVMPSGIFPAINLETIGYLPIFRPSEPVVKGLFIISPTMVKMILLLLFKQPITTQILNTLPMNGRI
jgi:hypothetical protein